MLLHRTQPNPSQQREMYGKITVDKSGEGIVESVEKRFLYRFRAWLWGCNSLPGIILTDTNRYQNTLQSTSYIVVKRGEYRTG